MNQLGIRYRPVGSHKSEETRHAWVQAVVWATYPPDHPRNKSGKDVECDVILLKSRQFLLHCRVLQRGEGVEGHGPRWFPVPCTGSTVDGRPVDLQGLTVGGDPTLLTDLDGEQVVVGFLDSDYREPIIVGSFVHTRGSLTPLAEEGRTSRSVTNGTAVGVDHRGAPFVDTRNAIASGGPQVSLQDEDSIVVTFGAGGGLSVSKVAGEVSLDHTSGSSTTFSQDGTVAHKSTSRSEIKASGDGSASISAGPQEDESAGSAVSVSPEEVVASGLRGSHTYSESLSVATPEINVAAGTKLDLGATARIVPDTFIPAFRSFLEQIVAIPVTGAGTPGALALEAVVQLKALAGAFLTEFDTPS